MFQLKYLLLICIIITAIPAADTSYLLRGVLLDTLFKDDDSLSVELLESGEVFTITYGSPFSVSLPDDNSWNLCVRSDSIEQCYVIVRSATTGEADSVLHDSIANDNRIEVFSPFIQTPPPTETTPVPFSEQAPPDSTLPDQQITDMVTQLRPVVIQVRKRPKRRIGQSTVTSKAIERQPGLAEADVVKAIQALPGVVASSDFSSKIYVRGGGSDQNLFLFDNGVVYSPVHFFGLFSTFLVDGIESVDFYKGGFSTVYGNRLSSVVDIKSRPGGKADTDTLTFGGSAQLTTFASTLSLEGSKRGLRLNLSGRSTYIKEALALLRKAGATDLDLDYRFYDLQGNLALQLTNNQSLTISGYSGKDILLFPPIEVFWGNTVVPVNYSWNPTDELSLRVSTSYSRFYQEFGLENIQTLTNGLTSWSFKPIGTYTGIDHHTLIGGFESQYFACSFGSSMPMIDFDYLAENRFMLHSLIFDDKWSLGAVDLTAGIRGNYFSTFHSISAEPRLSFSYSFTPDKRIEAHIGYYRQFINSIVFGDMETLNEFYYPAAKEQLQNVYPASSVLLSLGFTQERIKEQFDFIWEGYFKTLNSLFLFDPNSTPDSIRNDPNASLGDFILAGEGYSLGTEVSFRKTAGLFSGGFSYAFGFSVQKDRNNVYRAKWEIPHSFKLDGGITWRAPKDLALWKSKKWYLRSSLQIKYTSGFPYTEITGYLPTYYMRQGEGSAPGPSPSLNNNIATPLGRRNSSRYPSYGRFDLKLIDWGRADAWNFSWTILNIFDRENVFAYFYYTSEEPPYRATIGQFPFFPILFSYKRYF